MTRVLSIFILLFYSCKTDPQIAMQEPPKETLAFQKKVIGQLSGEFAITVNNGEEIFLKGRWSKLERNIAKLYLTKHIEILGLNCIEHDYQMTNVNPAVDLLVEPLQGTNLFTILPATNPSDEYVVLGAHYDTGGRNVPGAIDNGSGIALILSVLRRASKLVTRNKNLMVVFFDQEEEDISAGSLAFAQYLKKNKMDIHSVHSFDLIGWDEDNNKEVELALPDEGIENIYRKYASKLKIPIYTSTVKSSDHYSFIKNGIRAVCVSQAFTKGDNSGEKDTPGDGFHLVNFEYLESSTNLAFAVIKDLLNE